MRELAKSTDVHRRHLARCAMPVARCPMPLDAADVRRDFRTAIKTAESIDPCQWTPRELRHSLVSLLSDNKVPQSESRCSSATRATLVTELVYRQQIRPVLQDGAAVMDSIFGAGDE